MKSVLIYLTLFSLSAFCISKSKTKSNQKIDGYFLLAVLIPICFAALRKNIGTDFQTYTYIYEHNSQLTLIDWFYSNRSISDDRFLVWLFARISGRFDSCELFFGIFATLSVVPVAIRLKSDYSNKICFLSYFIYLASLYTTGLNICKQVASMGVIIYGLKYINERKFLKYAIAVFLASLIHITSIIAIFAYFLYDYHGKILSLKKIILIICAVIAVLMLQRILRLVGGRFESYYNYDEKVGNKMFFLNLFWCIIFCVYGKNYATFDKRNNTLITMLIIGSILELTGFISPFVKRIAMYYTCPQFLLLGQIPHTLVTNDSISIANVLIFVYTILLFILQFYILGQGGIIVRQ